jgi:Zn-dependent protease with chaperone function
MLIFGIGIIICFIFVVGLLIYIFNFVFLLYCWPILIGLWIGIFKKSDKGYEIELKGKEEKRIHQIVDPICQRTGQRRPHKIVLTEGSEVAVTGFFRKKIIIGMVALKLMSEKELQTILSHEYGHFANKDTVLGYVTYRIQNFIEVQKEINRQSLGFDLSIIFHLPTWLFFWLFSKYYSLISLWYSRRIEFRADSFACNLVGKQDYANTLVKYCIISELFEEIVPKYIIHYLNENKQIINLYEFIKPIYSEDKNINLALHSILSAKSSWSSTHPSISERMEALGIREVDVSIEKNFKSLLEDQEKYEKESSLVMTQKLAYWVALINSAQTIQKNEEENSLW